MKKSLILLIIVFSFTLISPLASSAHNFCNCPVPSGHDCSTACQNQSSQTTVCQCEGALVTFPSVSTSDCIQKCETTYNPQNVADKKYKICNCTVGTPYADGDICKKTCTSKSEFKDKSVCACTESTKTPKLAEENTLPEKEAECEKYCKPEAKPTTTTTAGEKEPEFGPAILPKLYMPIPDLNLTQLQVPIGGGATQKLSFPWIAEYVVATYKYALGIASILAVIMVMIAGILYLTSAGNPQRIGQAKNYIIGSITGLVILLGSYLILNLISPNLTQLGSVEVQTVSEEELAIDSWIDEHALETETNPNSPDYIDIKTERSECKADPSSWSGIGDKSLLGKLDCNASRKRSLGQITMIVLHGGASGPKNVDRWVRKCLQGGACLSSHYTIDQSGKIWHTLDEAKVGRHAGGWNGVSIGIDLENTLYAKYRFGNIDDCLTNCKKGVYPCKKPSDKETAIKKCTPSWSSGQMSKLKALIANIQSRIPTATIIKAHCESSGTKHSDPRNFNWAKIGLSLDDHNVKKCKFYPEYADKVREVANRIFQ